MNWLHNILSELEELELAKLTNLKLRGKEKLVFNYLLKIRKSKYPAIEIVCQKLDLSKTHFYKINSILISKIFNHLFENKLELFGWLKKNNFYAILKVELKNCCKPDFDVENKASFYLKCFRICIDFPFEIYDTKIAEIVGKYYLQSLEDTSESDREYIKYHLLFADCNRYAATRNPFKYFSPSNSFFNEKESELKSKKYFLALYYLYRTAINYYSYYENNNFEALNYINKAIGIKSEIEHFFDIDIGKFLQLTYADILLNNNQTEEAFIAYNEIFINGVEPEMFGYYYHSEQFIIASLCVDNFAVANKTLNDVFKPILGYNDNANVMRGLLSYSKFYLANGDYKLAIHNITEARNINNKSFYLPFDLQTRVLENMCFYLKNDFDFTKQLTNRNIKFLQALPSKKLYEDYFLFFKTLSLIASVEIKQGKVTTAILKSLEVLNLKFTPVYGNIISNISSKIKYQ